MNNLSTHPCPTNNAWPATDLIPRATRILLQRLIAFALLGIGLITIGYGAAPVGEDITYTLTVVGGSGSGEFTAGTPVPIDADPAPPGQEFDQWTGDIVIVADTTAASTSILMPEANATVTATYRALQYVLTVNNGTGSGNYIAGTIVDIVAANAPAGLMFDAWTGDTAIIEDVSAASTAILMPEGNATVTATYKAQQFTLIVNGGTGSGSYVAGTTVQIDADPAPAGQEFDQWTGDVTSVSDVNAASTSILMPGADVTLTAIYKARQYSLIVNSGTGSGNYVAGTTVDIDADPAPAGQEFDQWTGDIAIIADPTAASTSILMPEGDATVTATYKARQYILTVNSGTGSGSYLAGTTVDIVADPAPEGQEFDQWTGDLNIVTDLSAASTTILMPEGDATVTATYKAQQFTLIVNGGTGSGSYIAGTTVDIAADPAPEGQEFDQWTGDLNIVTDLSAASTTILMPEGDATVTATYKARHYTLTVQSGTGSGSYLAGTMVDIVADPAPEGQEFNRWTGDIAIVANSAAASTSITMPEGNATVTATYKDRLFTLTVIGGTGSGTYISGTSVNIVAAAAPVGQEFDQWIGDVTNLLNVNAASTSITMLAADATVTATYRDRRYSVTVNSGTGSGSYAAGATVDIVATPAPAGLEFDRWTGDVANVANTSAATTSITMPAANITVTATYKSRQFALTVNSGTGSGSYAAGATVNIVAAPAPTGQEFDRWTGDVANIVSVTSASTFLTMPAANATVSATYRAQQFTLTVNSGSGTGSYTAGTIVTIVAATAPAGQQFDRWTGDVENVGNVNSPSTFIKMPAGNASVTAAYKARQYDLTVNGGTGAGSYASGTTVDIVADPAPTGQEFDRWIGDVTNVADVNEPSTSILILGADAIVTSTYKTRQFTLTVTRGTGSGSYSYGTTVNIVAEPPPGGQDFDHWTGDVSTVVNVNAASTFITIPATNATVTATYKDQPRALTVNGGSGSGSYVPGTSVQIVAAVPPSGQEFDEWIGDIDNVLDVNAASTVITMPSLDAAVTATYKPRRYSLTVNSGSGSGSYLAGEIVNIDAEPASADQEFDQWIGDVLNVADINATSTSLTMPATDATLTAVYRLMGGISSVGPIASMSATGDAGMILAIEDIPVSGLVLGTTTFPTPNTAFPAENADDFDLNTVASADGKPYIECLFAEPVTTIFFIENGGNDSGFVQAYDALGNRIGPAFGITTNDYLRTIYRSGINQVVSGLAVRMATPVSAIRLTPPSGRAMGFDPISISGVPASVPMPELVWQWDPTAGSLELVWPGDNLVLQHTTALGADWSDVAPPANSPYVVTPEAPLQLFRLRNADPE